MAIEIAEQTTHIDVTTILRLNNLASFLQKESPARLIGSPFLPGLIVSISSTTAENDNWLGVYLNTTNTLRESIHLKYTFTLRVLPSYDIVSKSCRNRFHAGDGWGSERILSYSSLLKCKPAMKRNTIDLIIRIQSMPIDIDIFEREFSQESSSFVGRSLTEDERDVKFLLYKRRPDVKPKVSDLGVVYASSKILEPIKDYLASCSQPVDTEPPDNDRDTIMPSFLSNYDYEPDSDLDDDQTSTSGINGTIDSAPEGSQENGHNGIVENSITTKKYGQSKEKHDSQRLGSPNRSSNPSISVEGIVNTKTMQESSVSTSLPGQSFCNLSGHKVIKIPEISYKTWLAIIYYLYSGIVRFAPLPSDPSIDRSEANSKYLQNNPGRPELVSCKSIMRAAQKIGLRKLEERAAGYLESQLDRYNIVQEIFSPTTAYSDRIKAIESRFLFANLQKLKNSKELDEKVEEIISGKSPQCTWFLRFFPEPKAISAAIES